MSILDTTSGRIQPNWMVARHYSALAGYSFAIVAPYNDGLPGKATLGFFAYGPHAELVARAPALAEALENLVRYHESGGHEGDGSDETLKKARALLEGCDD